MARKMAINNSLTILLIKEEFTEFSEIIRSNINGINEFELINMDAKVYYVNSNKFPPSWVADFFLNYDNLNEKLYNSSSKATMLIKTVVDESKKERIFALVFGRGSSLVKDITIEERFGLKVVLNLVGYKNIRAISKIDIAGNQKNSIEQMPKQSNIYDFEIDIETDLVRRVTAKVMPGKFVSGTITGSDSLLIKHPVDIISIIPFLHKIYECYLSKDYLKDFSWIDQIKDKKNKDEIAGLDQELLNKLNEKNNDFYMAVPEIIDWGNTAGFKISGIKNEIFDDIYIEKVLDSFKEPLSSIDQLKRKKIALIDLDNKDIVSWSAYKCIYGELKYQEQSFCINNGKWYQINDEYSKQVEEEFNRAEISNIDFINYAKGQTEEEYNKKLTNSNEENFICLDRNLIKLGVKYSPIEICDVLTNNHQLIHNKRYSGSSTLSHLFNQGLISATLLREAPGFIEKGNDKIKEITDDAKFLLEPDQKYEIVYGILGKNNKNDEELPNIPFFSKISFCYIKKRLNSFNFKCSIKNIPKIEN